MKQTTKPLAEIVMRALLSTVTNIGQLSESEVRELDGAFRRGHLAKGKGGAFPVAKTVWAHPGFDFEADRRASLDEMALLAARDARNRFKALDSTARN